MIICLLWTLDAVPVDQGDYVGYQSTGGLLEWLALSWQPTSHKMQSWPHQYFFKFIYFILLAVQALSSVESRIYSLVAVHRLLITVASLVADTGFRAGGFSNCETWA